MSKIVDALRHEHKTVAEILDVLEREIVHLSRHEKDQHGDYTLAWAAVDYFQNFPDLVHRPKEDIVFGYLRDADRSAIAGFGDLHASHTMLSGEVAALAAAVKAAMEERAPPRMDVLARIELLDLARDFIEHQRRHLAAEEAFFFPVAERVLSPGTWAEIERELTARLDPLLGGESAERFEAQYRRIMDMDAARLVPGPIPTESPSR